MVAQELALTHPDRVRSLILAATSPGPRHAVSPGSGARLPKDRPHLALYSEAFAREHPDHVAEDIRVGSQSPQPHHARRRQWEAMQGFDTFDRLEDIAHPTLVLHGTADRLVPVRNAELLAERIPGARLALLEGAGHVYHSERADEADAAVLAFLDEVEAE
jgi:pimeloyl-ACP methyl ester carboxylesterase